MLPSGWRVYVGGMVLIAVAAAVRKSRRDGLFVKVGGR
jgi:hypothetical protein